MTEYLRDAQMSNKNRFGSAWRILVCYKHTYWERWDVLRVVLACYGCAPGQSCGVLDESTSTLAVAKSWFLRVSGASWCVPEVFMKLPKTDQKSKLDLSLECMEVAPKHLEWQHFKQYHICLVHCGKQPCCRNKPLCLKVPQTLFSHFYQLPGKMCPRVLAAMCHSMWYVGTAPSINLLHGPGCSYHALHQNF